MDFNLNESILIDFLSIENYQFPKIMIYTILVWGYFEKRGFKEV